MISDDEMKQRAECLGSMDIYELADKAGAIYGELEQATYAKIARFCALVAVGALDLPNSRGSDE